LRSTAEQPGELQGVEGDGERENRRDAGIDEQRFHQ
jgi:hypothetical protein